MCAPEDLDSARGHALTGHLGQHLPAESVAGLPHGGQRLRTEREFNRLLARCSDVRKSHPVGRQEGREGMDQHLGDTERVGNHACMLAARAPETVERVASYVVTA